MSKTGREHYRRGVRSPERYIYVDAERRETPDLRKLSRAVIAIALREAEMEAEALAVLKFARESNDGPTDQADPSNDGPEVKE